MVLLGLFNACGLPTISIILGAFKVLYYNVSACYYDTEEAEERCDPDWKPKRNLYLTIYFCQVAFLACIAASERALFGVMGEKLTWLLRKDLMQEMMYKQIGWFDRKDRAPGIITNVFNADIKALNGMTSETIVTIFEVLLVFTFGMTVCLVVSPPAALNAFIFSPIMIGGSYMMATINFKNTAMAKQGKAGNLDPYQAANALLADVVINYRTVVAFGQNNIDKINENFSKLLDGPLEDKKKHVN